ncbi:MAG: putative lipid II flippase FtsW, partial [Acidobacteriota bacterium]
SMAHKLSMDRWLAGTVLVLTLFGLTMVFSASAQVSADSSGSFTGFLAKQTVATILGLTLMFAATRIDYHKLQQPLAVWGLMAVCFILLTMALVLGGRWLNFGHFSFQPSELTKIVLLIFLVDLLSRKADEMKSFRGLLPALGVLLLFCIIIYRQPDFGTTATVMLISFCLFFIAGIPVRLLAALALPGLFLAGLAVRLSPYQWQRVLNFIHPNQDLLGQNYQMNQSIIAMGSGGLTGVGLGRSIQKLFFLPAAHTDFIFAVIGEELGLVGCLLLVLAYVMLLIRGLRTAVRAPDPFGAYLAAAITLSLVLQAFINMAVVLGLLPTKGLPLPFVSYGGSSLLISLAAVGLVLNVSQHTA